MKKVLATALALLFMLSVLPGCQKTPDSPIVVGKNAEQMLETAQKEVSGQTDNSVQPVDLYACLGAPKRYTASITSKQGKLAVHVEASVELPTHELPIVRITPVEFTAEQVQLFSDVLLGNSAHYVQFDEAAQTRAAYERRIERLRTGIADWENVGQYVFDLQYYTKEEAEKALSDLLIKVANAPEALPAHPPDFTWQKPEIWRESGPVDTSDTYMMLWTMPDEATYSLLNVQNSREFDGSANVRYIRDFAIPMGTLENYAAEDVAAMLPVSQADAQALAEQTVARMGLDGFVCSAKQGMLYRGTYNDKLPGYLFLFTRQINGVAETYTSANQTIDSYNKPWYYEKVYVLIDEKGLLRLEYLNPNALVETVMEETELLPFEQIKDIFEKMAPIVENIVDTGVWGEDGRMEYVINTVRLGLVSIREQNKETGLLVPAWDFLGYDRAKAYTDDWVATSTNQLKSYLTINAIDGSIIQREY